MSYERYVVRKKYKVVYGQIYKCVEGDDGEKIEAQINGLKRVQARKGAARDGADCIVLHDAGEMIKRKRERKRERES